MKTITEATRSVTNETMHETITGEEISRPIKTARVISRPIKTTRDVPPPIKTETTTTVNEGKITTTTSR